MLRVRLVTPAQRGGTWRMVAAGEHDVDVAVALRRLSADPVRPGFELDLTHIW